MPLPETMAAQPRIAVVEDDPIMGESLVQRLALEGYDTVWCQTGRDALAALRERRPDLLVCDIRLPDMSGEEVFRDALPALAASPVLFITAFGDIDQAVRLVRAGADDYLTKPFVMERFLSRIDDLLKARQPVAAAGAGALGPSAALREVESLLRRVADIDSTVLLTGESGVGKEVAARFLHQVSRRAGQPFMAVNCAAIPTELLESELFGHERGAFTGAHARHEGYAERARGGILFLDEVPELPPNLQAKLLRLVQERAFSRLGGEALLRFDARIVCATNADLEALAETGRFRRDLYYRINVIRAAVPPLRQRQEDIVPLLRHYVGHYAESFGREVRGLTTQAETIALAHRWPGNVRELRNRVERAVALTEAYWIGAADLFPDFELAQTTDSTLASLAAVREAAERQHIVTVLERTGGQMQKAAELLGVSRTTLWEKMRRLGIGADVRDS